MKDGTSTWFLSNQYHYVYSKYVLNIPSVDMVTHIHDNSSLEKKTTTHVHLLTGCRIHHDGDAPVSTFFHNTIERGNGSDAGTSVVYTSSVRGRQLKGIEQQVPLGYCGYCCVVNDTDDEGSKVCIASRFDSFTYWKHHVVPDSTRDSLVRCMEWTSTARDLHEDDDDK